ncbi:NTP transferase domain-containing protein [Kytococcus sedentarius]|uniref:Mannose-1-phosphate guanylyltransferase (GDP) n=1 Tax=Kytococcus sedentarius (strain ATCC 14392 / DSM 20547 / JCM 11482 / CCUG 33030 / NBRC 15357 / NCTC 11040 / CCM 314 / 541) TaxID=478801 RepID=C7NF20_KYTSD|nr:mannose-1-phosphate guanylyltransferase [Kytococcus sedentarius]ACV05844.1 mannose-1-phosphate guanylyltransferase (GDP) [Kytococcus sedentarius DSM 20547]QQB64246.1 NTP transferase domain-containing protein [Kytococcus sedentarius]STX12742.1 Mannose-1-phosphate guanylyltransferase 1 [Kytococcus sedentarius]
MTTGTDSAPVDGFWGIVPAGGSGTRLWPVSRSSAPKFLQDMTGEGRSMLQATLDRLRPLSGDRLTIVTGSAHADRVREQVAGEALGGGVAGLGADGLVVEPEPRESMPAIGLAAAIIARHDPEAVIGSFAADHLVGDEETFRACVREAVAVARTGKLVTMGIEPTRPATGFGYIRLGEALQVPGAPSAHAVRAFHEKPHAARAERFLAEGGYRWNAGMFVVKATVLLDLLAREHPDMVESLTTIAADDDLRRLDDLWAPLTKIAIDHAVAEPAAATGDVACVPGDFPWDDVGDFGSLGAVLGRLGAGREVDGLVTTGAGEVIGEDATGFVMTSKGRTVVTMGLDDVVVVDTPDAVLVTTRERAQDVKGIVARLNEIGREDLT